MSDEKSQSKIERAILSAISTLRYGKVEVVVHDSRVVQIEKSEKIRFDNTNPH